MPTSPHTLLRERCEKAIDAAFENGYASVRMGTALKRYKHRVLKRAQKRGIEEAEGG